MVAPGLELDHLLRAPQVLVPARGPVAERFLADKLIRELQTPGDACSVSTIDILLLVLTLQHHP